MLQRQQIAAARALLEWSRSDLAEASGVSLRTVARFESGEGDITVNKLARLEQTLTDQGIRFVDGGVIHEGLAHRRLPPSAK